MQLQKTKLDKVLSSRVYIEPDYVVYGTRVSSLKFRKFDPKIDYNQTIYNGRAQDLASLERCLSENNM